MADIEILGNFVGGAWRTPAGARTAVIDPATGEILAHVAHSGAADVAEAVAVAETAADVWRRTPVTERVQYLFRFKARLETHFDEVARLITRECGKTLTEARAEMRRGIENVETAAGMPFMSLGTVAEDIASGIDELMIRQPLGVVAAITPFNFPGMIPLWFLPYAIACGNCCIVKPSERVPLTMRRLAELLHETGLPAGVLTVVNGGKDAVDALIDHPSVRAISFVGSSPVAQYVYARAAAHGKRVQCQGGAKNPILVMPDADLDMTVRMVGDSAFGCAGQRCLAASVVIPVGDAHTSFTPRMVEAAASRVTGPGLDPATEMGPVISAASRDRIEGLIGAGVREGGRVLVDGRDTRTGALSAGSFLKPTVIETAAPGGAVATTEIFGPVLAVSPQATLEDAIAAINRSAFGNMACIFTSSGATARQFRYEARAGNIGVNIGVAAPMAFFPFSGWKGSFFGDLHAQGADAVEFYMDKKVVVERWPREWSRTF